MLSIFYNAFLSSVLFFGVMCLGGNVNNKEKDRIDKLIRKAESMTGQRHDIFKGGQKLNIFLHKLEGCMCSMNSLHLFKLFKALFFLVKIALYVPFDKLIEKC